jgi:hypothetical protein
VRLIATAGIVCEGLRYVTDSFMTSATLWAIIGQVTAVARLALIATGLLRAPVRDGRGGS